jgi:hypothetical protein
MEEEHKAYKVFVGEKRSEKRPFARSNSRCNDNIKIDLK